MMIMLKSKRTILVMYILILLWCILSIPIYAIMWALSFVLIGCEDVRAEISGILDECFYFIRYGYNDMKKLYNTKKGGEQ